MCTDKSEWARFLSDIARSKTDDIGDWRALHERFRVTLTDDPEVALSFFCDGVDPALYFPLDRQGI
jgi:hypothetical protein